MSITVNPAGEERIAAAIAINAFTGRFGGAGGGDCALAIIPGGGAESQARWFQPEWG